MAAGWSSDIWTGTWRWVPELALYTDPARKIVAQTAVVLAEGMNFRLNQKFELSDGTQKSWTWDGAFDGVLRPILWDHDGTPMADIAFYWLQDGLGGDTYLAPDGKTGAEYFQLEPGRLRVSGCYTLPDLTQWPYHEVWVQES